MSFNDEHLNFVESEMKNVMLEFGLYPNLAGFELIIEATFVMLKCDYRLNIKDVYRIVAEQKATSDNAVEKSIRHAIKHISRMGRLEKIEEIFGFSFIDKESFITNNQFISLLYLLIKKRVREKWGNIIPMTLKSLNSFERI